MRKSTLIYHITHIQNLPAIFSAGGLCCYDDGDRQTAVSIAHQNIQERRAKKQVPCGNGGNLHQYVPFYFAPRSPMLYSINKGYVSGYVEDQTPIVHIVSSVEMILQTKHSFVFTDGHATLALSDFYTDIVDLSKIDWSVMKSQYWNDTPEHPDRKRRRQAEFLVYNKVSVAAFIGFGVINKHIATQLSTTLEQAKIEQPVRIKRDWYY